MLHITGVPGGFSWSLQCRATQGLEKNMTVVFGRRLFTPLVSLMFFLIVCQIVVTYYIIIHAKKLSTIFVWEQRDVKRSVQKAVIERARQSNLRQTSKNTFKNDFHHTKPSAKFYFKPNLKDTLPPSVSILDILPYNKFTYDKFQLKEPNFISETDRLKFYRVKSNKELMSPVTKNKLTGVVEVIRDGSFRLPYDCGWASSNTTLLDQSRSSDVSADFLCPLIIPDGWAFQSFMDSTLPKIMQVYELLLHPSMKLLLEEPRDSIIHEILKRLGIRKEQLIFQRRYSTTVYRAKYMLFTCITPPLHPALWARARGALGVSETLQVPRKDAKIIVLSRQFAKNGGRKITNMVDLLAMLRARYEPNRVVVYDGHSNLTLTTDLFKQAHLIIGVHGGAFYNMNFAPKETTLIEISPSDEIGMPVPRSLGHTIFWTMSTLLNQTYWRLYHTTNSFMSNIQVNLDLLQLVLDKVDVKWDQNIK